VGLIELLSGLAVGFVVPTSRALLCGGVAGSHAATGEYREGVGRWGQPGLG
jgi:hypothetical protein